MMQYLASDCTDADDELKAELDAITAWLEAHDDDDDPLAWMANPAAVAYARQALLHGHIGLAD